MIFKINFPVETKLILNGYIHQHEIYDDKEMRVWFIYVPIQNLFRSSINTVCPISKWKKNKNIDLSVLSPEEKAPTYPLDI